MQSAVKILYLSLIIIFLAGGTAVQAAPEYSQEYLEDQVDLNFFDRYWEELEREAGEYLPALNWRSFLLKPGEERAKLDPGQIIGNLGRYLFGEVLLNIKLFGQLLLLSVAAAFLKNLETAFDREQVAALTRAIVFIVLIGVVMHSFGAALNLARETVDKMVEFNLALLPTLIALLASLGSFASAAIFHPLVIFAVNFFGTFVQQVILPLMKMVMQKRVQLLKKLKGINLFI